MNQTKKNPVFSFLNVLGQLVLLSILWTLCCIPIVTIGAASAALYYTVVKVLRRGQDSLIQAFFREFRNNFFQSLNITMVFLCYFAVMAYFAAPQIAALENGVGSSFYWVIGLAFLGMLPLSVTYPVISRFYHKGIALVRFILLIIGRHPHIAVASALLLLAGILLVLSNAAALLFVPGVMSYVQSLMLEPVFKKYSDMDDSRHYDTWYSQET